MADRPILPSDNALIDTERLAIQNMALENAVAEIEAIAAKAPARIDTDAASGEWQNHIAEITKLQKTIETTRESTKEPYLTAGRVVDGYFKALSNPTGTPGRLQQAHTIIGRPVLDYLRRKEAEQRRQREEEARRAREAQEAAEAAQRKAEAAQRAAEEEGRKRAAANQAAKAAQAAADASAAEARAFEAQQQAKAQPADLARTRSAEGTLATIAVSWDFEIENIDTVKGAPLWQYVTRAHKEQAIRAYIRANAPKEVLEGQDWQPLTGVRMIRKRALQVR